MSHVREYSDLASEAGPGVLADLDRLADLALPADAYGAAMRSVGRTLGGCFARAASVEGKAVYLAVTVEDADYLAAGIAESLDAAGARLSVACFWNTRRKAGGFKWLDVAPIVNEYREPIPDALDHLIVVKSIISGACVVKTNLMHLLDLVNPREIHIMAPVMLRGAEARLSAEFDTGVAERFRYWLLATDEDKDADGNVLPGIGGEIYGRLGFTGQTGKNAYYPEFIKQRFLARA